MAYADRYRCQFWDDAMPPELGYINTQFTVLFRFPDYVGSITDLRGSDEPVEIDIDGSTDDVYAALFPAKATFTFAVESHWEIRNLLASNDQQIQVQIIANVGGNTINRLIWAGWVQPTDIREKYADKPYHGAISATCGIALLKDRLLVDSLGRRFTGRPIIMDPVKAGLALTKLSLPITTGINLYETQDVATGAIVNGKANQSSDPLNRIRLQSENLITNGESKTAYDALDEILSSFDCRLAQVDGDWMLVRLSEAAGGWDVWSGNSDTIMTRRYNPDYVNGSAEAKNLNVRVGRTRNVRATGDCYQWGLPIKPALSVRQDFGGFVNHLTNGDFSQKDNSSLPLGWINRTQPTDDPICLGDGSEDDPFRLRIYGASTNDVTKEFRALTQTIQLPANSQTRTLSLKLTGRFRLRNVRSAMLWINALSTSSVQQWVFVDGQWMQSPAKKYLRAITISNVYRVPNKPEYSPGWQKEKEGWAPISIEMPELANIKSITINIMVAESLDGQTTNPRPYIEYADMKLEIVDAAQRLDGITLLKRVDDKKKKPEPAITFVYGDVPVLANPTERLGTLYKINEDAAVATTSWFRPDANIQTTPNKTLSQWAIEERAPQRLNPANVWDGSLVGRLPFGFHSVLLFDDILDTNGNSIPHVLTKWNWKLRSQRHKVSAIQKIAPNSVSTTEKSWETPDGPIAIEEDEAGNAISPIFKIPGSTLFPWLKPLQKGLNFSLTGTNLPNHLAPLDPNDKRFQLIAEVSRGNTLLGRVLAIARVKLPLPIIPPQ